MKTVKVTVELAKPMHDAIQQCLKEFPYYEGAEDFIIEAVRRHLENFMPILQKPKR